MKKTLVLLVLLLAACTTTVENQQTPPKTLAAPSAMDAQPGGCGCGAKTDCSKGECGSGCTGNGCAMMHDMGPVTSEEQFVVEMIPHHQEAVDTSKEVLLTTENEALADLLVRIIEAQEAEIAMMESWVEDWYDGGYAPHYMEMMPALETMSGVEKDNAYLNGMIMHHMMAVKMAREVLALEPRAEVAEFANQVIEVQNAEIAEMRGLLQ